MFFCVMGQLKKVGQSIFPGPPMGMGGVPMAPPGPRSTGPGSWMKSSFFTTIPTIPNTSIRSVGFMIDFPTRLYIYMVPPKDLSFLTYLFNILWFGMIIEQLIERGDHTYIYIYIYWTRIHIHGNIHTHMRWIKKTWQTHTDAHTQTLPKKLQTLQTFLDSETWNLSCEVSLGPSNHFLVCTVTA